MKNVKATLSVLTATFVGGAATFLLPALNLGLPQGKQIFAVLLNAGLAGVIAVTHLYMPSPNQKDQS